MNQEVRRLGLKWKIGGIYTAVMLVLGVGVIAGVYQLTHGTLRDQLDKRAVAIATNFSDAVAAHVAAGDVLAIHTLARKYTLLEGVAYVYIRNREGEIVAHTLGDLPSELRAEPLVGAQREVQQREVVLGERAVYETAAPVHEGRLGAVHIGFWADAVCTEIQHAVLPIVGLVAVIPVAGALLSFLLAHWIVRPIVGLREIADKVTMGDLETSVGGECVSSQDEIGDLARSLERMRSSLRAAMLRLGREVA